MSADRSEGNERDNEEVGGYRLEMSLRLPQDATSVPVVRHLTRHALTEAGVVGDVIDDIELAVSEACSNVVEHVGPGDDYEVGISIGMARCEIRVVDVGRGFDYAELQATKEGAPDAEQGRGLALMHILMDRVDLVSKPEQGTLVLLVKALVFDENAPGRQLLRGPSAARPAPD